MAMRPWGTFWPAETHPKSGWTIFPHKRTRPHGSGYQSGKDLALSSTLPPRALPTVVPAGPKIAAPTYLPIVGSHPPYPYSLFLQKYIAQVLQDSEGDGDGDGAPGSSGDEPPSSSQDEELLMPPEGLTDTDFQSCEDSLIENEIHQ